MGFRGGCIWVLVGGEVTLARGWGGGGMDILVSKGGVLAPPQEVM